MGEIVLHFYLIISAAYNKFSTSTAIAGKIRNLEFTPFTIRNL